MPSCLIVGATGNTGGGVLQHLAEVLPKSERFSKYRIIGLTRDTNGAKAKELARLPRVDMIAHNWTMIDSAWLQDHEVERIFIASHNEATHFTDESLFLNHALDAGVKYTVRISTTRSNVSPTTPPAVFISMFTDPAKNWVSKFKKDGFKDPYKLLCAADHPIAPIDSVEVGLIAGKLLALDDISAHASQKYCLNGPQNATGKDIINLVEKHSGTTVDDVSFCDTSFIEYARAAGTPENILPSLALAARSGYKGQTSVESMPTSPAILKLHTVKNGVLDTLDAELSKA